MIRIPDLEPAAIRAAHERIDPAFTRLARSTSTRACRARLGVPVIVKVETVNPIRSFKGRGTWVAVNALAGEGRIGPDRPIACVSAGNFGQGVAYAARALGIPAIVFTSRHANRGKVERMRALGAEVIEAGEDFDSARGASEAYAAEHPVELLVDGDDPRISTGAATLALEVTDAVARGRPARPGRRLGPGRQRRADQRRRLVAARDAARLPGRRRPGRGAPRRWPAASRPGRPIDTDVGRHLRRRDRDPGRHPARGRADDRPGRRDADSSRRRRSTRRRPS